MGVQIELMLSTLDWGEANFNPMVRVWGLKKDRNAKCKSCTSFIEGKCKCVCQFEHSADYRACLRYKNKKVKRGLNND
jgi:hypothetical protein